MPPQQWSIEVESIWEDLEVMNAVLLDESNKTKSIENYRSQIDESLDNLMVLIINAPEALIGKGERWIQNRKYEQSK